MSVILEVIGDEVVVSLGCIEVQPFILKVLSILKSEGRKLREIT